MTGDQTDKNALDRAATEALDGCRREVTFLRTLQHPITATRTILLVVAIVYGLGYALTAFAVEPLAGAPDDALRPIIVLGAKVNAQIAEGQWWRLVTSMFLHGGLLHLLVNGYALFVLGTITERVFGTHRFVLLYALSGLGGALASFWFNDSASVGASGAIFGVFGAAIVFGYRFRAALPPSVARSLTVGLLPYLVLNLAIGFIPFVDFAAHLGGLVVGAALALVLRSPLSSDAPSLLPASLRLTTLRVLAALCVVIAVASAMFAAENGRQCLSSADAWAQCDAVKLRADE